MPYNKKRFIYKLCILLSLIITHDAYALWIESRYFVPDLCSTPLVTYRRPSSYVAIQPFVISADEAYTKCFNRSPDERIGIYELGGQLSLTLLDNALLQAGIIPSSLIKTEWLAAGLYLPAELVGRIDAAGVAWNVGYSIFDNCTIGWAAGAYNVRGILQLQPRVERKDYPLTESYVYEFLQIYSKLTQALGVTTTCFSKASLADNELYLRYECHRDFCLRMRTIKGMLQVGTMIPTAQPGDISIVSSLPGGSDKHWGIYGSAEIDFVLKEDVTLSFLGRLQFNLAHTSIKRVPFACEPILYGAEKVCVSITPGLTGYFSPALTLEGIRNGLGFKFAYSLVAHGQDSWDVLSKAIPASLNINNITARSSWLQEHFLIALFYDFMRDECDHTFEPFVGFSIQIPVDWAGSYNAAKSWALSCIIETLY